MDDNVPMDGNLSRKRNALLVVIGANLFLVVLKFTLANLSGSVSIRASGWMSVENLFLTGVVLLGVLLLGQEDERTTRRLNLLENVLAIVISVVIFLIAGRMFVKMFLKMAHGKGHAMLMYVPWVTAGAILGALICYFMSRYKIFVGQCCASPSIEAAGYHCRTHVYMEVAVIVGLLGYAVGLKSLNMLAVAAVLTYVLYVGLGIFIRAYRSLTSGYPPEHSCHIERNYRLIGGFTAALLLFYLASGVYTIAWNEQGVVKRFGRYVGDVRMPGLHYHLPWPVEVVQRVRTDDVRSVQIASPYQDNLLVAGDENLVSVNVGVHYVVQNAADYLFQTAQPDLLVRDNVESAIRDVIGTQEIDILLTSGKREVEQSTLQSLQQMLDQDRAGVRVLSVQVLTLDPPKQVADAFRDIANAKEDRQTYIYEAEARANQILPEARGKAKAMIHQAGEYQIRKTNHAQGESVAYLDQLVEYQKAREITDLRLYLETMEKILPGTRKVLIDADIKRETTDLWLLKKDLKGKVVGFGD